MSTYTISENVALATISCSACGILYAFPESLMQYKRDNGGDFHCPNGHSQIFSKPTCTRLREELDTKQRELTAARCETLAEKNGRAAAEKEMARHKKRMKNGVCPCCQRSFINLQRHMATKHPEFK